MNTQALFLITVTSTLGLIACQGSEFTGAAARRVNHDGGRSEDSRGSAASDGVNVDNRRHNGTDGTDGPNAVVDKSAGGNNADDDASSDQAFVDSLVDKAAELADILDETGLVSLRPGQICGGSRRIGKYLGAAGGGSNYCQIPTTTDQSCDRWGCAVTDARGDSRCPAGTETVKSSENSGSGAATEYFVCVIRDPSGKSLAEINNPKRLHDGDICGGTRTDGGENWGCAEGKHGQCATGSTAVKSGVHPDEVLCVVGKPSDVSDVKAKGFVCGGGGNPEAFSGWGCGAANQCPDGTLTARTSDEPTSFLCVRQ